MSNYNEQQGGLWSIDIYEVATVTGWSPVMNDSNGNLLVFPAPVTTFQVEEDSINVREDQQVNSSGKTYTTSLSMNTIGLDAGVQAALDAIDHKLVVVKTTDHDGVVKLYGSNITPLTILSQTTTGQNREQGKGAVINCAGTTLHRAIYL